MKNTRNLYLAAIFFLAALYLIIRIAKPMIKILPKLLPITLLMLFVLAVVFVALEFKGLLRFLKKQSRRTWQMLALILVFAFVMQFFVVYHAHRSFPDESYHLETAKNIIERGEAVQCYYQPDDSQQCTLTTKTPGWSFIQSPLFLIPGIENIHFTYLTSLFSLLSIFMLFVFASFLFNDSRIGLWAAFLLSLDANYNIFSTSADSIGAITFFLLLSWVFFLLSWKQHKISLAFVFSYLLMIFIRVEYSFAIIPVIIYILLDKPKKIISKKNLLLAVASIPFLAVFVSFCIWFSHVEKNSDFGIGLLIQQVPEMLYMYIASYFPVLLLFFLVLGMYFAYKQNSKAFVYTISWFFVFFIFYSVWDSSSQIRLTIGYIIPLMIFMAKGIVLCTEYVSKKMTSRKLLAVAVFIVVIALLFGKSLFDPSTIKLPGEHDMRNSFKWHLLETSAPGFIEANINSSCAVLYEWPTTITSTTSLKAYQLELLFESADVFHGFMQSHDCVYFYEGLGTHSSPAPFFEKSFVKKYEWILTNTLELNGIKGKLFKAGQKAI